MALAVAMLALAVAILWHMARPMTRALRARSWVRAEGRILDAGLHSVVMARPGPDGTLTPAVRYEYDVGNRRYVSDVANFVGHTTQEAIELFNALQRGQRVEVWYDPKDPAKAVLDRSISPSSILWCLLAIVLALLGSLVLATP